MMATYCCLAAVQEEWQVWQGSCEPRRVGQGVWIVADTPNPLSSINSWLAIIPPQESGKVLSSEGPRSPNVGEEVGVR